MLKPQGKQTKQILNQHNQSKSMESMRFTYICPICNKQLNSAMAATITCNCKSKGIMALLDDSAVIKGRGNTASLKVLAECAKSPGNPKKQAIKPIKPQRKRD